MPSYEEMNNILIVDKENIKHKKEKLVVCKSTSTGKKKVRVQVETLSSESADDGQQEVDDEEEDKDEGKEEKCQWRCKTKKGKMIKSGIFDKASIVNLVKKVWYTG